MGLEIKTSFKDNATTNQPFADNGTNPSRPNLFWEKRSLDGFPVNRARADNNHLVNQVLTEVAKIREQALSRLVTEHGLNLDQISRLTLNDIDMKGKKLVVTPCSGSASYLITLTDDTIDAIRAYLRVRSPSERNELFLTENGQENNQRSAPNVTLRISPEDHRGEDIDHAPGSHT